MFLSKTDYPLLVLVQPSKHPDMTEKLLNGMLNGINSNKHNHAFISLSMPMSIILSIYLSNCTSMHQSIYLSICTTLQQPVHPSIHPSTHPSIHPSIYPSILLVSVMHHYFKNISTYTTGWCLNKFYRNDHWMVPFQNCSPKLLLHSEF